MGEIIEWPGAMVRGGVSRTWSWTLPTSNGSIDGRVGRVLAVSPDVLGGNPMFLVVKPYLVSWFSWSNLSQCFSEVSVPLEMIPEHPHPHISL